MYRGVSIAKPAEHSANEDSFWQSEKCVAVSDGAGGCGLFANKWSEYLIEKLPKDRPITTFGDLDTWVDGIWESFYDEYEEEAKEADGILLNKFYNEGSCATIASAWFTQHGECRWMAYGDSVVFHYSMKTGRLEHSFTRLADFSRPPRLVSCKDPLEEEGFKAGTFQLDDTSVVFVASDALSHYVLMMYELTRRNEFTIELDEERGNASGNAQLLMTAESLNFDFEKDVLTPLIDSSVSEEAFRSHMEKLHSEGLLDMDDFTFVMHEQ